ncbi:MAG: RiPP maturation radical SAM protein 1 [Desulfobacterales bacterium]|nr:RiPP maturation radical SAM protein 1 [Desulfobacterales bacterium]
MIHLVNMPFAFITCPNLALGTVKAQLVSAGMDAAVFNLNLSFAHHIGFEQYAGISFAKGIDPRISEWLFAEQAWGNFHPDEEEFFSICRENLRHGEKLSKHIPWLSDLRKNVVPGWIHTSIDYLAQPGDIKVAGFSCSFYQTVPAIALGRHIKNKYPDAKLVYGGSSFQGEMGHEIISKTSWIDAVSTGEADDVVVPLFSAVTHGQFPEKLDGIFFRDAHGEVCGQERSGPVSASFFDSLPVPDFDDYFNDARRTGLSQRNDWQKAAFLPFESSRGCWKAKKQVCRFCGINPVCSSFRVKSTEKAVQNLDNYLERYPLRRFHAADSNLAPHFFNDLLLELGKKSADKKFVLFFEVTSGLKRKQIQTLAKAGIFYVQAGIENLDTRLLDLMDKGVTALDNLFFLKCCMEYNIMPFWNFLVRIPGERREDYDRIEELIPKVFHLRPPVFTPSSIQCHRFSTYFENSETWIENVTPGLWYCGLFPSEKFDLNRVAWYFDGDWKDTLSPEEYQGVTDKTDQWRELWKPGSSPPQLTARKQMQGTFNIKDTRHDPGKTGTIIKLDLFESKIYKMIADPATPSEIIAGTDQPDLNEQIINILEKFIKLGLAVRDGNNYLGLAVMKEDDKK